MAVLIMASLFCLQARLRPRPLAGCPALVLAVLTILPFMTERPWLVSVLLSIWVLHAVLALREGTGRWWVCLLPVVFALWANLHIQFVYGLFLLGLGCVAPVVDHLLGLNQPDGSARRLGTAAWWRLVALTGACTAATLLTPYHVRLYGVVFEVASIPAFYRYVDELTAPNFRGPSDWTGLVLLGAAVFALGRLTRRSAFEVLLLAAAAAFVFRAKRDLWFVAVAAVAVLALAFPARPVPRVRLPWDLAALLGVGLAGAVFLGWRSFASESKLEAVVRYTYPVDAVAFLRQHHYPGPLYNDFGWGGYLVWNLPELPVLIDGRGNLYGDEGLRESIRTSAGFPGWHDSPGLVAANVLLVNHRTPLAELLFLDPRYRLAYEDPLGVAAVFVPAGTTSPSTLPARPRRRRRRTGPACQPGGTPRSVDNNAQ
jgi:hypothetical protein